MNKKAFGVLGAILTLILIFILIGSVILFWIIGLHVLITENGRHTGYVTAIETNGWLFKTDSVYFKTETESSQEDRYCIIDKELKTRLEQYQKEKKRITIEFYDWMFYGIKYCKGEDIAIISGVEE